MTQILHYTVRIKVTRTADGLPMPEREFEIPLPAGTVADDAGMVMDLLRRMQLSATNFSKARAL